MKNKKEIHENNQLKTFCLTDKVFYGLLNQQL